MHKKVFKGLLLSLLIGVNSFAIVNFNTATKEELIKINGIGEKKASLIIEYRKENKINSVEDLSKIKGFGEKLVTKIKESIK